MFKNKHLKKMKKHAHMTILLKHHFRSTAPLCLFGKHLPESLIESVIT